MNTRRIALAFLLPVALALGVAAADGLPRTPSPKDAELYIISPKDGDTVKNPVTVQFGLRGMGGAPAGVARETTGHHPLRIDTPLPPVDRPIPADEHHVHFGKGQTEASVTLGPGKHTLQLLLGDHLHIPHDPPVASTPVTITVE